MEEVADIQTAKASHDHLPRESKKDKKWVALLLNGAIMVVGSIGTPLLSRLYFLHGGSRKWVASWLQTAGFPILLIPTSIVFLAKKSTPTNFSLIEPKLLIASIFLGSLYGLDNYMYSLGLSYLPVSTSSLLFATQLAFTALFAFVIVRQRFTAYSINAVVLMTVGTVILGIRKSGDRPPGDTNGQYLLGFLVTLGAAALLGFTLPCTEYAYTKVSRKAINYEVVLQFQLGLTFSATVVCTIGMLINNDFKAIGREARAYELGEAKYCVVLLSLAIASELLYIGTLGILFYTSSFCTGVLAATLLPLTEVASVVAYQEKFTAEKGLALALCLWGFVSYFYGEHRNSKKQKTTPQSADSSV